MPASRSKTTFWQYGVAICSKRRVYKNLSLVVYNLCMTECSNWAVYNWQFVPMAVDASADWTACGVRTICLSGCIVHRSLQFVQYAHAAQIVRYAHRSHTLYNVIICTICTFWTGGHGCRVGGDLHIARLSFAFPDQQWVKIWKIVHKTQIVQIVGKGDYRGIGQIEAPPDRVPDIMYKLQLQSDSVAFYVRLCKMLRWANCNKISYNTKCKRAGRCCDPPSGPERRSTGLSTNPDRQWTL